MHKPFTVPVSMYGFLAQCLWCDVRYLVSVAGKSWRPVVWQTVSYGQMGGPGFPSQFGGGGQEVKRTKRAEEWLSQHTQTCTTSLVFPLIYFTGWEESWLGAGVVWVCEGGRGGGVKSVKPALCLPVRSFNFSSFLFSFFFFLLLLLLVFNR